MLKFRQSQLMEALWKDFSYCHSTLSDVFCFMTHRSHEASQNRSADQCVGRLRLHKMFLHLRQICSSVNLLFSVIPKNIMKNHEMTPAVSQFANTSDRAGSSNNRRTVDCSFRQWRSINFHSLQRNSVAPTVIEFSLILDSWHIIGENNWKPLVFVTPSSLYSVRTSFINKEHTVSHQVGFLLDKLIPVRQHFYSGLHLELIQKCIKSV